jgi:hypothetical protein
MLCCLTNVAQTCNLTDEARWPQIIREHVQNLLTYKGRCVNTSDFEAVRSLVKVRLYANDYALGTDAELLSGPFAESILAVVAIDLPTVVATLSRKEARAWGVDDEHLFELGYENAGREDVVVSTGNLADGVDVIAVTETVCSRPLGVI